MNVLITSSGRRTTLLKAFKEAANRRGGLAFAGDADDLAPTLFLADRGFKLPRLDDAGYIQNLLDLVERHQIGLIVPTIDTELPMLAASSKRFHEKGCVALVSSESIIECCQDKWQSMRIFGSKGFRIPHSWLPAHINFNKINDLPDTVFIKPRCGSASQNTYRLQRDSLEAVIPLVPNPIIQECIFAPEITIDALLNLGGQTIHFVPRLRIKALAGESIQGRTFSEDNCSQWIMDVLQMAASLGAKGPITVQAFLTENGPTLSEINPRFGGGIPLTLAAGGNYPEWILQILEGEQVKPRIGKYTSNLRMTRYYEEIFDGGL